MGLANKIRLSAKMRHFLKYVYYIAAAMIPLRTNQMVQSFQYLRLSDTLLIY